jgi:3-hydroxyacyl-[acyl-carrier-protein] dehydratase
MEAAGRLQNHGAVIEMMEKALSFLPHGPEFRFLDRLTALEPGKSGRAEYKIRGDEPFLRGHFPGEPIFPGVLLVEAAAQLAGVVAQSDPAIPPLAGLELAALRQVKILGAAKPGQTLELEAEITGRMGNLIQTRASVRVAGETIVTTELTLAGMPPP